MQLNDLARQAWMEFLGNKDNRGHSERELTGSDIDCHVDACWQSALATVERISQDFHGNEPNCILEVGASTGLNCFALRKRWPQSRVIGIEPEYVAVRAAQMMAQALQEPVPEFILGYGESLPLPDASVDLIVCHTVIEHVQDVEAVVAEMSRVLSPQGVLHLEAPNYVWPYEPHLGIWCLPVLGKAGVKLAAVLQGKKQQIGFLEHLQFVTPSRLEAAFRRHGLTWDNRVREKILRTLNGDSSHVMAYRHAAAVLRLLSRIGMGRLLVSSILWLGLYPSLLYSCRRCRRG
ncbi:class I SAM-dependent methyltransferase [Haematospirillum jordaniae]|uniref:class I SAM-dependent methyltransferase n=1 Tax=Haematospirillum jordaniae TaxID=1549855 RepID=UPI0014331B83|nr:class I SAM-dependent methyltransferase [Haematospirillum jordaniae]NKD86128.1 class I SAM-dependent methyltransferase [Haematospirillum jordaniae]